jgi:hypothetical protein
MSRWFELGSKNGACLLLVVGLCVTGAALPAQEVRETILAGDPVGGIFGGVGANRCAFGWFMERGYSDVTVAASMANGSGRGGPPSPGVAYLMRAIGPGTTADQEVASKPFELPPSFEGMFTFFSGLNLPPGRYWLVLVTPGPPASYANVEIGKPLALSAAEGSHYLGTLDVIESRYADYPPASAFSRIVVCHDEACLPEYAFVFRVEGVPVAGPPISETGGQFQPGPR